MDEMVHEISREPDELARRAILRQHGHDYPGLMYQPAYPKHQSCGGLGDIVSDSLLFVANLTCFGRRTKLLFRFVYTAVLEQYDQEVRSVSQWLYFLEMASQHQRLSPGWDEVDSGFLSDRMIEVLEGKMIEHERTKRLH
jgi:hypothetical protein